MKLIQISPHGWQLKRFGLVNAYLVRESDDFTLVDTGLPGSAEDILECARHVGSPVNRILLTHAHGDHVGSVDKLRHLLGQVEVAISQREARLLPKKPAQDRSTDPGEPPCKLKGSFPGIDTAPTHLYSAGELYGSLRCIPMPGHTPGQFGFLDERDGTFYAGDSLVTVGGKPLIGGYAPWYFPLPNFATWHRPTARRSIEQLLQSGSATVPIRRIAPGHGPVLEGGAALLQAALAQAN